VTIVAIMTMPGTAGEASGASGHVVTGRTKRPPIPVMRSPHALWGDPKGGGELKNRVFAISLSPTRGAGVDLAQRTNPRCPRFSRRGLLSQFREFDAGSLGDRAIDEPQGIIWE
jgi:hypothetical protein